MCLLSPCILAFSFLSVVLRMATHRLLFRLVAYTLDDTQTQGRSRQNDLLARFIPQGASLPFLV